MYVYRERKREIEGQTDKDLGLDNADTVNGTW